jgi:hypothetical protein
MAQKIIDWVRKNEKISVFLLVVFFVLIRLPGVHLPLHQDEYKWPMIVNPANQTDTSIPHPPIGEFIYRTAGHIVGYNVNFRFVPFFFGAINLILLYYLARMMFGRRQALVASLIWVFSYFSVLASLMVDTDGEILPFFFLLALIGYFKLRSSEGRKKFFWGIVLIVSCILGFLVKVSFILAISAIAADFLWSKRHFLTRQQVLKYISFATLGILGLIAMLIMAQCIFPFFNLGSSFVYWEHFIDFHRDWLQIFIQCIKATLYVSPFLICVPLLASREILGKLRVFMFFLIFSFIFYVVLFDFSLGALDRYLQLIILPLTMMSAGVLAELLRGNSRRTKEFLLLGSIAALVLVLLQSVPHYVPPLHPKAEWISRVLHFKWNFLYPFSGGSGPLGFYVSFLFMALAWIVSFFALLFAKIKPQYKKFALFFLIPIGIAYNGVFIEEYLFGYWNGYAPGLLKDAVQFIKDDPDIKMVTVYNDNGGNEIQEIGKYRKRLYIDPKFDINQKVATLNQYKEHYFVLDVPRIDPTSVYQEYFDSCKMIYDEVDKSMSAKIYDCRNAPDIKI